MKLSMKPEYRIVTITFAIQSTGTRILDGPKKKQKAANN